MATFQAPVYDVMLSVAQAAERLGITVKTLQNMISKGRIGAFRRRPLRIPESEVLRVLAARYQPPIKVWSGRG